MAKRTTNALESMFTHNCKVKLLCFTLGQWERILPTNLVSFFSKSYFQSMKNFMKVVLINWCFSSLYAANYLPLHDFFQVAFCSLLLLVYYYIA